MDLSQCVNVRVVHIGIITLDQPSPTLRIMHTSLSALPSNSVEEIVLTFKPPTAEEVAQLEHSFWSELVASVQKRFPMLKRIAIRMGFFRNGSSFWSGNDFHSYIEAWRKQLEQEALVSLDMIPWGTGLPAVSLTSTSSTLRCIVWFTRFPQLALRWRNVQRVASIPVWGPFHFPSLSSRVNTGTPQSHYDSTQAYKTF